MTTSLESASATVVSLEKKPKVGAPPPPSAAEPLPCPRCHSHDTKFCYYNNYNFSQPRYFCKSCRRYWTRGGALRDVPVGGASRKPPKRPRTASPASSNSNSTSAAAPIPTTMPFYSSGEFTTLLALGGFGLGANWITRDFAFMGVGSPIGGPATAAGGGSEEDAATWQMEGVGEYYSSSSSIPELAISTTTPTSTSNDPN